MKHRKRPIRHRVGSHTRVGRRVTSYMRGQIKHHFGVIGTGRPTDSDKFYPPGKEPTRRNIENKLEELASKNRFRQVKYVALRKEFPDVSVENLFNKLDRIGVSFISSQHNFWCKVFENPRYANIRQIDEKAVRSLIKTGKKHKAWDGVTFNEIRKYMRELEEEKGYNFASSHAYIFYRRRRRK